MNNPTLRDKLLGFYIKRERILHWVFGFIISLISILTIATSYGYLSILSEIWLIVAACILSAFLPIGGKALVIFFYMALELYGLSLWLCIVFVGMSALFFIMLKAFGAKHSINLFLMTVLYRWHLPFLCVFYSGLFGKKREVCTLVGGCVIAFYLRSVRLSAVSFRAAGETINPTNLIYEMFTNPMLYVFIIAVVSLFLVLSLVKNLKISHPWYIATVSGIFLEFLIMLSGYLLTDSSSQIPFLALANSVALAFGLFMSFLFEKVKVERSRELEFEDDEYRYKVVAIPKIRIENHDPKVRRITKSKRLLKKLEDEENAGAEDALQDAGEDKTETIDPE